MGDKNRYTEICTHTPHTHTPGSHSHLQHTVVLVLWGSGVGEVVQQSKPDVGGQDELPQLRAGVEVKWPHPLVHQPSADVGI